MPEEDRGRGAATGRRRASVDDTTRNRQLQLAHHRVVAPGAGAQPRRPFLRRRQTTRGALQRALRAALADHKEAPRGGDRTPCREGGDGAGEEGTVKRLEAAKTDYELAYTLYRSACEYFLYMKPCSDKLRFYV